MKKEMAEALAMMDGFLMATSKEGRLHYDLLLREAQTPT